MAEKVTILENRSAFKEPRPNGILWGPIGEEVYKRTYSRLKPDGKQETWQDTVERVVDGNLGLVQDRFREPGEREKLFELLYHMKMIPGGRHLWATGVPGRQYLSNCHSAGWSRRELTEHFTFTFEELLKGGGVGSNYSNRYIEIYPPVFSAVDLHVVSNLSHPDVPEFEKYLSKKFNPLSRERFVIEDSREGWSAALAEVLRSAWYGRETPLIIDVSMLRERGAILRSFGGKSSGPAPLVEMLTKVTAILNSKVGKKLSSTDMMEIDHEISRVVVAGGIRRSARMSIKHWADRDIVGFIHAKIDKDKLWTTNISVEVDDDFFRAIRKSDKHATMVLHEVSVGMHRDGEPGFWNSSLSSIGELERPFSTNPCLTYDMPIVTDKGIMAIGNWAESSETRRVWDGKKWVKAKAVRTGMKPVVRLRLSNGVSLRMTADHRVGTLEGGEASAGEAMGVSLDFMHPILESLGEIDPKMVMTGFVQGDGGFHRASGRWKYVYIGEKDGDVLKYFSDNGLTLEHQGGEASRFDKYTVSKADSMMFADWLMPASLSDRHLTSKVVELDPSRARSFLRGLYSANGCVHEKYGRISLKSVNQQLILNVQTMLTLFGIRSYMTTNAAHEVKFSNGTYVCKESYDLNITSEDARRFRETIGFIQSYKSEALDRMLETIKPGRRLPVTVVAIEPGEVEEVFDFQMEETHWASVCGFRIHNCGEIAFGMWDICCLGHINLDQFAGQDAEAQEAFRLMTRFLIRATFGDIANPLQKEVISRNRRIGVGFFGYSNWITYQGVRFSESHHNQEIRRRLRSFRDVCREEAREYAFKLRIPQPIKVTCIAPTGTISNLPGVTSGCQPIFARYFRRRVRYAEKDENLKNLTEKGFPIEVSLNEPATQIVSFFCKDPLIAECERRKIDLSLVEEQSEISLSDHLAVQSMLQQEYADNAISYTINFDPKKVSVEEVEKILCVHLPHLKGTTLMPEESRPQMPLERIAREEFEGKAREGLTAISDAERECQNGICPVK